MRVVHILHHSISPFAGQYPDKDPLHYDTGLPMKFARAIKARYPALELECWRPERTARQPYRWVTADGITHRVFPSAYLRYGIELSRPLHGALRAAVAGGETYFFMHGSYNLHTYWLASLLEEAPAILQSHGGFPASVMYRISRHRWLRSIYLPIVPVERARLARYPHLFAISSEEAGYLRKIVPETRVSFSPTGLDFDQFAPQDKAGARSACGLPEHTPLVLYVGRLSAEKGLEYLLGAMPAVVNRFGGAQLLIVGSGPLQRTLEQQVESLGLNGRVSFIGHVAHDRLAPWFNAADVTVMPSLLEWFGMVAAESLACGTPVVATQAGGAVDIVREFECGVLAPPRDADQLAAGIIAVLSGTANTHPNIERGRQAFDWSVKLSHAFRLFEDMVSQQARTR